PDLTTPRTDDFVLIEILLSVGRSVKVKKKILSELMTALTKSPGLNPDNVMVCFKETQWENWAFAGGRLIHTCAARRGDGHADPRPLPLRQHQFRTRLDARAAADPGARLRLQLLPGSRRLGGFLSRGGACGGAGGGGC